jgi:hypothetical protein
MSYRSIYLLMLVAVTLMLVATGCTMWPEKKDPGWDQATGLEQMERRYWEDIQTRNFKELEARTASTFSQTSVEGGVRNKQQTLDWFRSITMLEHSLGEFEIFSHGDTTTVTYLSVFRYKDSGGNIVGPVKYRQTSVWQQQKSGWVLIANAAAEIKQ